MPMYIFRFIAYVIKFKATEVGIKNNRTAVNAGERCGTVTSIYKYTEQILTIMPHTAPQFCNVAPQKYSIFYYPPNFLAFIFVKNFS
jgi:hypothetical protein